MSRHLIVLPDDSPKAFLKAIAKAKESLRIKMFIFSDPAMRKAVIAAHKRGVKVRVMLNPARREDQEVIVKHMEQFFFGDGQVAPKEYVPPKQ